jgi:hypothetical protein
MDWVSVLLGFLVVLIYLAIFSLLRTMYSPFVKRFEIILKTNIEPLPGYDKAFHMKFSFEGKDFELRQYNIKFNKAYNEREYKDIMALSVKTEDPLFIRFRYFYEDQRVKIFYKDFLKEPQEESLYELSWRDLRNGIEKFYLHTNDCERTIALMDNDEINSIISCYAGKEPPCAIPFAFDEGKITLFYNLSPVLWQEIVGNPRTIKKHIRYLSIMAEDLKRIPESKPEETVTS